MPRDRIRSSELLEAKLLGSGERRISARTLFYGWTWRCFNVGGGHGNREALRKSQRTRLPGNLANATRWLLGPRSTNLLERVNTHSFEMKTSRPVWSTRIVLAFTRQHGGICASLPKSSLSRLNTGWNGKLTVEGATVSRRRTRDRRHD